MKRVHGKGNDITLQVDASMNFALKVKISEVSNLVATIIYSLGILFLLSWVYCITLS
jgi:hypothetical protein